MSQSPPIIFINYRHGDSKTVSRDIARQLKDVYGNENVFIDTDLKPGDPLRKSIDVRLNLCTVLLAMIGNNWDNESNLIKLRNPEDWVRREIKQALIRSSVRVIPVLIDRGENGMPIKESLPEDIQELTDRLAATYNKGTEKRTINSIVSTIGN